MRACSDEVIEELLLVDADLVGGLRTKTQPLALSLLSYIVIINLENKLIFIYFYIYSFEGTLLRL